MAKSRPVLQLSPPFTMSAEKDEITQPKGVQEKRQRQPSRKALQNMIQSTTVELSRQAKALRSEVENVYTALRGNTATVDESALQVLTQKYKEILTELECLYAQDKWGDTSAEAETVRQAGFANLEEARTALNKAKSQCYEDDRASRKSQYSSRVSSSRSSRSSARAKALAEAAAANKQAEYDRIIAEKQHLRKQQEATYERDMALLAADKLAAVADAKLAAIENCIQEEERSQSHAPSRKDVSEDARHRTEKWVDAQNSTNPPDTTLPEASHTPNPEKRLDEDTTLPFDGVTPLRSRPQENLTTGETPLQGTSAQEKLAYSPNTSSPKGNVECVEMFTTTHTQLTESLARQSLPKCHPDTFGGDATLFHPWRTAFKAMLKDAKIPPEQEINYLRQYTKGDAQKLVDSYRKRRYRQPASLLQELWAELEKRFGNPAVITDTLLKKLSGAAKFNEKERGRLQAFADLCADVDSQLEFLPGLACLNYPNAIKPIVEKLPNFLRSKWEKQVAEHADRNQDAYPSFNTFAVMMQKQASLKNHPNIVVNGVPSPKESKPKLTPTPDARVFVSNTTPIHRNTNSRPNTEKHCLYHDMKGHDLANCKAFDRKNLATKTEWIMRAGLCFKCLSSEHQSKDCNASVSCEKCRSSLHHTVLHLEKRRSVPEDNGEELRATCTAICHTRSGGLSCSKIVLLDVFPEKRPDLTHRVYAVIDDQSNASMISPSLADKLGANGPREKFLLSTCSAEKELKYGRRVPSLIVRSIAGEQSTLPILVECDQIPRDKSEIPTPEIAREFSHLKGIADQIPPLDQDANIELLIGRDAPELLKVRDFRNGPKGAPWAQKLKLGWTVSGEVCLDRVGGPVHISVHRSTVDALKPTLNDQERCLDSTRSSNYEIAPCPNHFVIKEEYAGGEQIAPDVYRTTANDNEVSLSQEDRRFLEVMNQSIHKNTKGNWEMPLPFRSSNVSMPNNRSLAVSRLNSLLRSFKRNPQLEKDYFAFMAKVFDRGHATRVPPSELRIEEGVNEGNAACADNHGRVWYLPHFGVYHPRKPDQIRVVFDSSAEFEGVSLNKELLPGPDQMNSLLGVLVRFRQEGVALICDVEQMFHSFYVNSEHRDFLRFLWFKNNNPLEEIVEYRMLVHLFGNVSSPAIATFAMRKTAEDGEEEYGLSAKEFVNNDFYVDDGLTSRPTDEETVELLQNTQAMLATAQLRLHKAVSNSVFVMEALPEEDRGKSIRDLDLQHDSLPTQRSLGVHWDLEGDAFTFKVVLPERPYTRRGVLSVINSVYDPLGLAAPVILRGKLLLRQLVIMGKKGGDNIALGWDDPLPERLSSQWQSWRDTLVDLENVSVPRCYHPKNFGRVIRSEIHSFSDASKDGIGVATYLRQFNESGQVNVAFLFGQAKMAPLQPTTIPRLELCGAVLSSQVVKKLSTELSIPIHEVVYYTDSKVALGYIQNDSRRFYVYVANRVQIIRNVSDPSQWRYIDTALNPADLATRGIAAENLKDSKWLSGPEFLREASPSCPPYTEVVALDVQDPEVRSEVAVHVTGVNTAPGLDSDRFSRFSSFASLRRALANLIVKVKEYKATREHHALRSQDQCISRRNQSRKEPKRLPRRPSLEELQQAEMIAIRTVQNERFADEMKLTGEVKDQQDRHSARRRKNALKKSSLYRLDPFMDSQGVLRVGGRLRRAHLSFPEKHPVLLPKGHHLSHLIVRHQHGKVHHQGRQITHGAVRAAGFWIVGGHGVVSKVISSCVTCKKLRGASLTQHMADLPSDRTETPPPFTNVGCDVFGPWNIQTRRLRGGAINSKRWGLVFTCLNSRAIHIEVLESMDASAFICALRRFLSVRGPTARIRCDRGSNFVGAKTELEQALQEMDEGALKTYLADQGCEWSFNPPHASHFGGVWERQIGTIRRVLDAMLLELGKPQLTHELLVTLLAEVSAIVNARPISTIPSDVDDPQPLSPAMLLTLKSRPLLPPPGNFIPQDLYARRRWKRAQYLADQFWVRWRREYLQSLQKRPKWNERKCNLATGDVVIVRDKGAHRNDWLLGKVVEAIASDDGGVRKANVLVRKDGALKTYLRPISELVLIVHSQDSTDAYKE